MSICERDSSVTACYLSSWTFGRSRQLGTRTASPWSGFVSARRISSYSWIFCRTLSCRDWKGLAICLRSCRLLSGSGWLPASLGFQESWKMWRGHGRTLQCFCLQDGTDTGRVGELVSSTRSSGGTLRSRRNLEQSRSQAWSSLCKCCSCHRFHVHNFHLGFFGTRWQLRACLGRAVRPVDQPCARSCLRNFRVRSQASWKNQQSICCRFGFFGLVSVAMLSVEKLERQCWIRSLLSLQVRD